MGLDALPPAMRSTSTGSVVDRSPPWALRAASSDIMSDQSDASYETLPDSDERERARTKRSRSRWLLVVGVLLLCSLGSTLAVLFRARVLEACYWLGRRPPLQGGLSYAALVAAWLVALLPTSLLEVAAGFVFGFWRAAFFSTLGKFVGSTASFGLGSLFKNSVRRCVLPAPGEAAREHGYLRGLELAMKLEPFRTCLALRLAYVPEAIQNYTPAVFEAPAGPFVLATLVGSVPYAMLWAHLGCQIGSARELAADRMSPEKIAFFVVGAASLLGVFGLIHWNTKRTLARFAQLQLHEGDGERSPPPTPAGGIDSPLVPPADSPVPTTRRTPSREGGRVASMI
mmetsp:Transcript_4772/g.15199  ORF Transcript_4772/g.15199 Transcript_4772/m.15199 type:complete len:342 (-) Transcript_4772:20-1045(-)